MALISFCSTVGSNTGIIDCDLQLASPAFMFVGSAAFTPTEYASEAAFKAAILDRIRRPNGDAEKLYPFSTINGVNRTTEADTVETAANGQKRTLRIAPESYEFDQWNVGVNQESGLTAFNGANIPVFIVTDSGQMVGKYDSDSNFVGHKAQINTKSAGFSTYANGPITKTSINFIDSLALSTNLKLYEFAAFDASEYQGLLDVKVTKLAAPTGNAHKVGVVFINKSISKGSSNLYDTYDTELAVTSAFRGWTSAGALVAPTAVAVDTSLKGWTVTFGVAVAKIDLATPIVLTGLNVTGIEGIANTSL